MKKILLKKWKYYGICAILVCVTLCSGCGAETEEQPSEAVSEAVSVAEEFVAEEVSVEETAESSVEEEPAMDQNRVCMDIETPYAVLQYPEIWQDQIRIEQNEDAVYTVSFYGSVEGKEEQHLFDLFFGGEEGFCLGSINHSGAKVDVYLDVCELVTDDTWSEDEVLQLRGMQEDSSYVVESLSELMIQFENSTFAIETPYVTLQYPVMWQDMVRVEQIEGDVPTVQFFARMSGKEEQHLFDLCFGGQEGDCLGTVEHEGTSIALNIISYPIQVDESWTEEEVSMLYGMKEDVNVIIDALLTTGMFSYPEE